MGIAKTYFIFAAIAVLVSLHLLHVGLPPALAFLGMIALAISSFRKSAWLAGVYIAGMAPTTLLMIGYQLYPNFAINAGRFLSPQNIKNAYLLSNIILLTSLMMFSFARGVNYDLKYFKNDKSNKNNTYVYIICLISLTSNLYYYQGSIFGILYTGAKVSILGTNVFEAFYLILLLNAITEIIKYPSAKKLQAFGFVFVIIVINTFLNGARADILGSLIAFMIAVLIANNASIWMGWAVAKRAIVIAFPATLLAALLVGLVRSEIAQGEISVSYLAMIYSTSNVFDYVTLILGTWADTTFVGQLILHLADAKQIDWLLGKSYLDILSATLPTSIYADRAMSLPENLQSTHGTGGGAFLPAVFFWNGAIWGVVILSAMYGMFFNYVERHIGGRFYLGLYLVLCASALRAIIYSEQTLYKYILIYIILFVVSSLLRKILNIRLYK